MTDQMRMGSTRAARPLAVRRRGRTKIILPVVASAAVISAAFASLTLSQQPKPVQQQSSPSLDTLAQAQAQGYSASLVSGDGQGQQGSQTPPLNRDGETVVVTVVTPQPTQAPAPSQAPTASPSDDSGGTGGNESSGGSGGGATHYPVGELQEYAAQQASSRYGWGSDQMSCLIQLWDRESGWNPNAENASSGAYGIPQALPGNKMGPGWDSDPHVQINWGLGYIAERYGSPCGAWGHSESVGWY